MKAEAFPFDAITDFVVTAVCTVLEREGAKHAACLRLEDCLSRGDQESTQSELEAIAATLPGCPNAAVLLLPTLPAASRLLGMPSYTKVDLLALAEALDAVAGALDQTGATDMAYNVYECAYHVGATVARRALRTATALRERADPSRRAQREAAIWRCAIEAVRECLATGADWLAALDAVELALAVTVEPLEFQQELYAELSKVVKNAQGTPIAPLLVVLPLQA